ncbi:sensor histidine kinase [Paraburkholderia sp. BR13439]|uniref:sensor histidine kinase n=1 Tax=Paraburkholderia sp. BR13439 TaxID=3236996 RepID=UPI0034CE46B9
MNIQKRNNVHVSGAHKDEFLATLAHELRNPLAPLQAAVRLLRLGKIPVHRLGWLRDVLERQVAHLVRLVDDLLDLSRIAEGKFELRKEHIDLSSTIRRAIEGAKDLQGGERHDLAVQCRSHRRMSMSIRFGSRRSSRTF